MTRCGPIRDYGCLGFGCLRTSGAPSKYFPRDGETSLLKFAMVDEISPSLTMSAVSSTF
jgi:hypothetical protein